MSQTPAAPPTTPIPASTTTLNTSVHCIRCGYDLIGLPADGVCPECGTHVEDSNRGTLLQYSTPEYLERLHRGVFIILAGIIASVLLTVGTIIIGIWVGLSGAANAGWWLTLVANVLGIGIGLAMLYGWWLFSEPDPKYAGTDRGDKPRQILRIALIVSVATAVLNAAIYAFTSGSTTATAGLGLIALAGVAVGLVDFAARIVRYFSSMLYVQWIGARVPNERIVDRAKLLMWLGPVLMTIGALIIVGPLIALILYWNLLDWVRKDLKAIRGV